jgi:hypothetical protein
LGHLFLFALFYPGLFFIQEENFYKGLNWDYNPTHPSSDNQYPIHPINLINPSSDEIFPLFAPILIALIRRR